MADERTKEKQSFIAEARREQIWEAAVRTLDEVGYVKASLSQIAQRAGISTALISYHFTDKTDLMNYVLDKLMESSTSYVLERVRQEQTAQEKLNTFILASLAYQGTHPVQYSALLEIIFNARTPDNVPYYRLNDEEDDIIMQELVQILREGQENGEFGSFHVDVMANMIQGAIGEYMLNFAVTRKVDLETYGSELIELVNRVVKGGKERQT